MLKAQIYLNNELLIEMTGSDLDPLLYEVANWCDQTMYISGNDKLVIKIIKDKVKDK